MSQNQLPILSRDQIDDIAESYLADFQPEALKEPMEVDVEGFLEIYLGVTPDFQYLSHNMIYLGMAVFHDTNRIPIYDPLLNRAEYFSAKANTAIFDRRLVEEKIRNIVFVLLVGTNQDILFIILPILKE